jgi:hypothetical protein
MKINKLIYGTEHPSMQTAGAAWIRRHVFLEDEQALIQTFEGLYLQIADRAGGTCVTLAGLNGMGDHFA